MLAITSLARRWLVVYSQPPRAKPKPRTKVAAAASQRSERRPAHAGRENHLFVQVIRHRHAQCGAQMSLERRLLAREAGAAQAFPQMHVQGRILRVRDSQQLAAIIQTIHRYDSTLASRARNKRLITAFLRNAIAVAVSRILLPRRTCGISPYSL